MRLSFVFLFVFGAVMFLTACGGSADTATSVVETRQIQLYLTDEPRYISGIEPYEAAVYREIPAAEDPAAALLRLLFEGPTDAEYNSGLRVYTSGCSGFSSVVVEHGTAHVYLTGDCASQGATYTIASLIFVNLKQLEQVSFVKIYDQEGQTGQPEGASDSIPFSLEP